MPSRPITFTVRAWSAWSPERVTRDSWMAWAGQPVVAGAAATPAPLPLGLRRRVSPVGQRMMAACLDCGDAVKTARYVFASRHGELTRTVSIMESLAAKELPSPADFSLSVHNALAGLLSIHTRNTAGHTALAAGPDTFSYALIDAIGGLADEPGRPVLVCFGDDVMSGPFARFSGDDQGLPMVLALVLATPGPGDDALTLTAEHDRRPGGTTAELSLAAEFLRFWLAGHRELSVTAAAAHSKTWSWQRVG
jgi:Beta-ketoacyl synthase, N-terminal domain